MITQMLSLEPKFVFFSNTHPLVIILMLQGDQPNPVFEKSKECVSRLFAARFHSDCLFSYVHLIFFIELRLPLTHLDLNILFQFIRIQEINLVIVSILRNLECKVKTELF